MENRQTWGSGVEWASRKSKRSRERKLNTNLFFSQPCRAFAGYPGKIPGYPGKKIWFPWFRRTYRTFWPPPLQVEDPYPNGKYPDSKVWDWVLFPCLKIGWLPTSGKWCGGFPGQVWDIRFCPLLLRFQAKSHAKKIWECEWKSQTLFYQTSATNLKNLIRANLAKG